MKTTKLKPPRKTFIKGRLYWIVQTPKLGGGRIRKVFRDKHEAQLHYERSKVALHKFGAAAMDLDEKARADALRALEMLKPFGATLLDAARDYAKRAKALQGGKPLAEAVKEFEEAKAGTGLSERYKNDLKLRLARFVRTFPDSTTTEIQTGQINSFLRGLREQHKLHENTANTFRRDLRTFFEWCVDAGYCQSNPATKSDRFKAPSEPITTLTAGQFAMLLSNAEDCIRPAIVLAGFCAVRQAEIAKLDWRHVDLKQRVLTLDAGVTKTNSRRTVTIPQPAVAWLKPIAKKSGAILSAGAESRAAWDLARLAAGFGPFTTSLLRSRKAQEAMTATQLKKLVRWPENSLRHSAISNRMALPAKDAAKAYGIAPAASLTITGIEAVALEAGNSPAIIRKHYNKLSKPSEAQAWFAVLPGGQAAKSSRRRR